MVWLEGWLGKGPGSILVLEGIKGLSTNLARNIWIFLLNQLSEAFIAVSMITGRS